MNHAAEHLCLVAILNPFEEPYLLWRAKTRTGTRLQGKSLVWFHVRVTQYDFIQFYLVVRHRFLKELAIAETAKYI